MQKLKLTEQKAVANVMGKHAGLFMSLDFQVGVAQEMLLNI